MPLSLTDFFKQEGLYDAGMIRRIAPVNEKYLPTFDLPDGPELDAVSIAYANELQAATGRDCGSCTLCCKLLAVEWLDKPANRWCEHCKPGEGCGIYQTRPAQCGTFLCLWAGGAGPEEMRPDRSHVIFDWAKECNAYRVHVEPTRPDAWRAPAPARIIRTILNRGQDVILRIKDTHYGLGAPTKPQRVMVNSAGKAWVVLTPQTDPRTFIAKGVLDPDTVR